MSYILLTFVITLLYEFSRSTLHMFTGISGDFAEFSEHEVTSKTTQNTRDTRDSACVLPSYRRHIERDNVRQTCGYQTIFTYTVTDDDRKNEFNIVFQWVKYRYYSEPR